ncbi:ATP-binding protein [Candidatus Magnetomorum sp. HK-1]|nr:ATP-binding protein [Candidatus Magnetomorum sp. HK-1]
MSHKQSIVYQNICPFINREKELDYLKGWIQDEPKNILFIYGPKSSGKTTLLMNFINIHLNNKHYNIKHFNLREVLIANYIDFIQAFFEIDYSKERPELKQKTQYSLKVFKLSREIKKSLENKTLDPFVVMKKELIKLSKKGKRPVIIIDELQALEDIYLNGQRELLKELFNFFVAMTKESHLCHVIIASSDGYFMKRIFEDSKLTKTSRFYLVDYLTEEDSKYWLNHLESESAITRFKLSEAQIEMIWKFIGGSMWEISNLLGELQRCSKNRAITNEQLNNIIQEMIDGNCARFNHYARLDKSKILLFKLIYKSGTEKDRFVFIDLKSLINNKVYDNITLSDELNRLVQLNYLAFNPTTSTYQLQGKSMFYGLKKFVESLPDDLFDND